MSSESAWSEAGNAEGLHLALLGLSFAYTLLQALDLRLVRWCSLRARRPIHVHLQSTLYVPFHALTQPAIVKALTHLETDDLVLRLHQVIEHIEVGLL